MNKDVQLGNGGVFCCSITTFLVRSDAFVIHCGIK